MPKQDFENRFNNNKCLKIDLSIKSKIIIVQVEFLTNTCVSDNNTQLLNFKMELLRFRIKKGESQLWNSLFLNINYKNLITLLVCENFDNITYVATTLLII